VLRIFNLKILNQCSASVQRPSSPILFISQISPTSPQPADLQSQRKTAKGPHFSHHLSQIQIPARSSSPPPISPPRRNPISLRRHGGLAQPRGSRPIRFRLRRRRVPGLRQFLRLRHAYPGIRLLQVGQRRRGGGHSRLHRRHRPPPPPAPPQVQRAHLPEP
jgi:hypothetical protein